MIFKQISDEYFKKRLKTYILITAIFLASSIWSAPLEKFLTHTVRSGETLWKIARDYDVSIQCIRDMNNLGTENKLHVNQVLIIPQKSIRGRQSKKESNKPLNTQSATYHKVQKGDTLWKISKIYQVSIDAIIEKNNIDFPEGIKQGQVILIPAGGEKISGLQSSLRQQSQREKEIKAIRSLVALPRGIYLRKWRYIIIHHSGTDMGNAANFNYYHTYKRHMVNGLAYQFVIDNGNGGPDGNIEVGKRWIRQINGGHVKSEYYNYTGIGICLVGNFDKCSPSPAQMRSLTLLVKVLQKLCNIPVKRIIGHKDIKSGYTACPGKFFLMNQFKRRLLN